MGKIQKQETKVAPDSITVNPLVSKQPTELSMQRQVFGNTKPQAGSVIAGIPKMDQSKYDPVMLQELLKKQQSQM